MLWHIYGSGPTGHTWGPTLLGAHVHHGHDRQQCWWQDCLERASGEEPHRRFPPTQGPTQGTGLLVWLESTLQGIGSKDHDFVTILTCCPRGLGWLMVSICSQYKLYHLLVAILWVKPARFNETNLRMSQRSRFERLPVQCLFLPSKPHWVADAAGCLVVAEVIFADPTVLSTLSRREVVEGLAEAIKMGVIRDAQLFEDGPGPGKSGKWALKIPSGELAFWLKTTENICCPGATEQILRGMEHYLVTTFPLRLAILSVGFISKSQPPHRRQWQPMPSPLCRWTTSFGRRPELVLRNVASIGGLVTKASVS